MPCGRASMGDSLGTTWSRVNQLEVSLSSTVECREHGCGRVVHPLDAAARARRDLQVGGDLDARATATTPRPTRKAERDDAPAAVRTGLRSDDHAFVLDDRISPTSQIGQKAAWTITTPTWATT